MCSATARGKCWLKLSSLLSPRVMSVDVMELPGFQAPWCVSAEMLDIISISN